MSTKASLRASEGETRTSTPLPKPLSRRAAILDLILACGMVLLSLPWASPSTSPFRRMHGLSAVLVLAGFQFGVEGLVPLLLIAFRRERFAAYGFNLRNLGKSVFLALVLAAAYDLGLSWRQGAWLWVPLRRHMAMKMSLAAGFPANLVGMAATIAVWGILEAFFGIFFARRINQIAGHSGTGWLSPGALGFALFNGALHFAIGQGLEGFLTSFASGYAIAVIPAVTQNAWGGALFQSLTNAAGRL